MNGYSKQQMDEYLAAREALHAAKLELEADSSLCSPAVKRAITALQRYLEIANAMIAETNAADKSFKSAQQLIVNKNKGRNGAPMVFGK